MKLSTVCLLGLCLPATGAYAHGDDNPLLASVMLNQLETGNHSSKLDAEAWAGYDLNKVWLKVEGERREDNTKDVETQLLFSHAIAPFWDLQAGIRHDSGEGPSRDWGVLGIEGLAPYFFDTDLALFIGEQGRLAARAKFDYEFLLTQRLILSPDVEINLYGQNDPAAGTGSGISDVTLGLRLRYEIRREFAPYIGITRDIKYGNSADFAKNRGESTDETQWVVGLRVWF